MKRRIGIGALTGFGANAPTKIDGKETDNAELNKLIKKCSKAAYESFYKGTKHHDEGYVDAQYKDHQVRIGIEATYMYDHEKIICISKTKENSYIETGYCRGAWGSQVCSTRRYYSEYKNKSKFVRFVDHWHAQLVPVMQ